MILILFTIGFVSILCQVVLLRELAVASFGIELIYILALGFWLMFTGLGALIGKRRSIAQLTHPVALILLFAIILPVEIVFARSIRIVFGGIPGAFLPLHAQLAGVVLAIAPVCLLLGSAFTWTARFSASKGINLAKAYAIESVGGVAGGICSTMLLALQLSNLQAGIICGMFALTGIIPMTLKFSRLRVVITGSLIAVYLVLFVYSGSVDNAMTRWNHPQLASSQDTPYGRSTVTSAGGQLSVFENDALVFETGGTEAEVFSHLSAVQHPNPHRVLVLGGGYEGIIGKLLEHKSQLLDYVELNRRGFELVIGIIPDSLKHVFNDESVNIFYADPRKWLAENTELYDLVLVGMPDPESGQTNRFYTEEFFRQAANHLSPGGVVSFKLRAAENLWSPQLIRRNASIYKTLKSVFFDVVVLPGTTVIMLASNDQLSRDSTILCNRLVERNIHGRLVSPRYIGYLYTNDRFKEVESLLNSVEAPLNLDNKPLCYQLTVAMWLSKFYQPLAHMDLPDLSSKRLLESLLPWIVLLSVIALMLLLRRYRSGSRLLLVGVAALVGMVVESALLLYYQAKSGVLYQDIGMLVTAFMAGLAAGAWLLQRFAGDLADNRRRFRLLGLVLLLGFAVFNVLLAYLIIRSTVVSLSLLMFALFITGGFVAAVFAYASESKVSKGERRIGQLYAADLVGASIGAIVGSIVLIPMAGMTVSLMVMAVLVVCAMILV